MIRRGIALSTRPKPLGTGRSPYRQGSTARDSHVVPSGPPMPPDDDTEPPPPDVLTTHLGEPITTHTGEEITLG